MIFSTEPSGAGTVSGSILTEQERDLSCLSEDPGVVSWAIPTVKGTDLSLLSEDPDQNRPIISKGA